MSAAKKIIEILKEEIHPIKPSLSYLQLVELFPLQNLTSNEGYETGLKVMERLIDYVNLSPKKDDGINSYIQTLASLIEEYERRRFGPTKVSGGQMLAYLMELKNLKQTDLSKELGGQSVVSAILAGKRELNLKQIRALSKRLKVDPRVFI